MKTFIAVAIIALLTAGALPAFAQGGQGAQERIDTAIAHARSQGVPVSLLESKMAEGKAKGVPLDRIAAAIERREASLERAAQAMKGHERSPTRICPLVAMPSKLVSALRFSRQ
jgi:hypothetical protein